MSAATPSTSTVRGFVSIGLRAADFDFARLRGVFRLRAELRVFFARLFAAIQLQVKPIGRHYSRLSLFNFGRITIWQYGADLFNR